MVFELTGSLNRSLHETAGGTKDDQELNFSTTTPSEQLDVIDKEVSAPQFFLCHDAANEVRRNTADGIS